ncbi:hypothetical protein L6R52_12890 [Myxococcota bacterium]|nr:hypothetical protein [Myxococcota bacterium]
MKTTFVGSIVLTLVISLAAPVFASDRGAPSRRPFWPTERAERELVIDQYQKAFTVERVRTEMKKFAIFHAEPQTIEKNAVLVFEIESVSKYGSIPRWRCIAVGDVAECLGRAVKLRYLPDDEKIVLHAIAKPRDTREGRALVAAAHAVPHTTAKR